MITSINELGYAYIGDSNASTYAIGWAFYKAIGCGPSTQFIYRICEAQEFTQTFIVTQQWDVQLINSSEPVNAAFTPWSERLIEFLGFEDGKQSGDLTSYIGVLNDCDEPLYPIDYQLDCNKLWVTISSHFKEQRYYHYYEDDETEIPDGAKCIGLAISSIVEGSDVEVMPVNIHFPFTTDDLNQLLSEVNAEATFYWERDNYQCFTVSVEDKRFIVTCYDEVLDWGELPEYCRGDFPSGTNKHHL